MLGFNQRAVEEGSLLHVSMDTCHLDSCVIWDDVCMCPDLIQDPGRIFDTPAGEAPRVPIEEAPGYFNYLAGRHKKGIRFRYDGHVINCKNGLHFRRRETYGVECPCPRILENPERYFRIPESEWLCKRLDDDAKKALKEEWMRFKEVKKFNIVCQLLGKTYRYVETEGMDYHLNTCSFSYSTTGIDSCGCHKGKVLPHRYFVETEPNDMYKIRGEKELHWKGCARVELLLSKTLYGDEFPENVECDCK